MTILTTSSLAERLKKKRVKSQSVVIDGDTYQVSGLTKRTRGECFAKSRSKSTGLLDNERLESMLLAECVCDESGEKAPASCWEEVPSHITGPLMSVVMRVCGLDREDLADPKDSAETTS